MKPWAASVGLLLALVGFLVGRQTRPRYEFVKSLPQGFALVMDHQRGELCVTGPERTRCWNPDSNREP